MKRRTFVIIWALGSSLATHASPSCRVNVIGTGANLLVLGRSRIKLRMTSMPSWAREVFNKIASYCQVVSNPAFSTHLNVYVSKIT